MPPTTRSATTPMPAERLKRLLHALDLTRLVPGDDRTKIAALCASAATKHGSPAAVCVLPDFVVTAVESLNDAALPDTVRVATVANFPAGDQPPRDVLSSIERSLRDGADEIDLVMPWRELSAGHTETAADLLRTARDRIGSATLKVILETGALTPEAIDRAADLALEHGADFLKTSTGVGHPGADLPAAARLLERISAHGGVCGLKVSGGIRTTADADAYLRLAEERMGKAWTSPDRFRIGASGLFTALLDELDR